MLGWVFFCRHSTHLARDLLMDLVVLLLSLFQLGFSHVADLECYMGRNPVGYKPHIYDVCHRYRFHQTPQCLKFTQGSVVTRDCDPSFLCERFNVRNRCVRNLGQANLFGEICCCSTDRCNSKPALGFELFWPLIGFVLFL